MGGPGWAPKPRRPKGEATRKPLPDMTARNGVLRARVDHGAREAAGSELRPDEERVTPRVLPVRVRKLLGG